MMKTLDFKKETDKLILWRRITLVLKDSYNKNANKDKEFDINNAKDKNSRNKTSHTQGREVPPVTYRETCQGRC